MNELALFAGAGGGILGGLLLGWRTVCAVEIDPYCAGVLLARQNDGILPPFPIWDDVRTFDGTAWRGIVDVVSGGFPCQDISCAGRGAGIDGERSGLWSEMARIVGEVRPRYVLVENVPALTHRGLGRVLGDLAALGYDAQWGCVGAVHAGAPHRRLRLWIVAYTECASWRQAGSKGCDGQGREHTDGVSQRQEIPSGARTGGCVVADAEGTGLEGAVAAGDSRADGCPAESGQRDGKADWWATEPGMGRVVNGLVCRVDRLKALGNGQVPRVVQIAWNVLLQRSKQCVT